MLYDPKWGSERDKLISWLVQQNPDMPYDYSDHGGCMLSQFYDAEVGITCYFTNSEWKELPPGFDRIAQTKPWTFGAALERARGLV
jgi:hypothetical protein